jgi:hypothetical protein
MKPGLPNRLTDALAVALRGPSLTPELTKDQAQQIDLWVDTWIAPAIAEAIMKLAGPDVGNRYLDIAESRSEAKRAERGTK